MKAGDSSDNDDLPDSLEPGLTEQQGGPYEVGDPDTDNNGFTDGQDYVYFTQAAWTVGAADSQDWAAPGHQY